MSDEMKSRKNRRRQRSRKKKATVTIESIAPGRAPLGVYHSNPSATTESYHAENQVVTPSSSEWSKITSNRDSLQPLKKSFIQLPSGSPLSTPTSAPQPMSPQPGSVFSLQRADATNSTSFIPRTPTPASASQYSPQSTARSDLLGGKARSLPRSLFPPDVKERLNTLRMASRKHFIRPSSQTVRSRNFPAPIHQDSGYELHNFDDLPSSHPVSLSALCTRASSRNKGSKSWKPFRLNSDEDKDIAESPSTAAFFVTDQKKPRSRLSALHRANSGDCNLNRYKENASTLSRFCSQQYSYDPGEQRGSQTWQDANTIHYQDNPLNYSHNYDFSYAYSHSQQHSYISQSPFLRTGDHQNPEHLAWSTNLHSVSHELSSMGISQPILYNQNIIAEDNLMPDSSFNIYCDSFDHPDNQSPYQSMRVRGSHYDTADAHGAFSTSRSSLPEIQKNSYIEYSPISWEFSSIPVPEQVQSSEAVVSAAECQLQTSVPSHLQLSIDAKATYKPRAELTVPEVGKNKYTKVRSEEEIRQELKNAVREKIEREELETRQRKEKEDLEKASREKIERDELEAKQTGLHKYSMGANATHPQEENGMNCQVANETSIPESSFDHISESSEESDQTDSEEMVIREPCRPPTAESSDAKLSHPWDDFTEKLEVLSVMGLPGYLNIAAGKRLRPPPGIPEPAVHKSTATPLISMIDSTLDQRRLDDANNWFHRDARGEEQLREQVRDIAHSYAERFERLNGTAHTSQGSTAAKQMNLLLGNVIVNLHSYVSENSSRDAANFAEFGDVKNQHCEPSLGGRRSYFNREPSVDHWRQPVGRGLSTMSNKSEQSFSSTNTKPH